MSYSTFARRRIEEPTVNKPTDEQLTILDLGRGRDNLMIRAFAGTGKTTTLEMLEKVVKEKPILYLVFNKKNADEATKRMASTTTVRTLNSLGHRIWGKVASGNLTLDPKKTNTIFRSIVDETKKKDEQQALWDVAWQVYQGVALGKALGYIPESAPKWENSLLDRTTFHGFLEESPDDLTAALIDEVLRRSITQAYRGAIDFNDQVYMPALFGGTYPQFPLVLVDEAQDLSPVNHAMLHRLCVKSRLIFVGDPFQNIYGFRGAKAGSMAELRSRYSAMEADLSISFRCPRAIVENARWRVPEFKWIKEGGHVEILDTLDPNSLPEFATIICRNNAPLLGTAFKLLAMGRSVNVSGADIGPRLVTTLKKLGPEELTATEARLAADDWLAEKLDRESKTAPDMHACMKVFLEHGRTLGEAIRYAEHLFAQTGSIRLTTGHKAKGLEWDTVYHLDPWILGDGDQEDNLRYVIQTRSKNRYFEIDSGKIKW